MSSPGAALEPHPYAYPYGEDSGGVSCATCGGWPGASLHDPSLLELERPAPAAKRRRRAIYISGWNVRVLVTLLAAAIVTWGLALGDVWLWRLLYGR